MPKVDLSLLSKVQKAMEEKEANTTGTIQVCCHENGGERSVEIQRQRRHCINPRRPLQSAAASVGVGTLNG